MSRHTPGPWETRLDEPYWLRVFGSDGHAIAKVYLDDAPVEDYNTRQEANARLIAAAPELLQALKGVVYIANRETVEFDAARAAIAKAEGREQP